jgi:Lrp/AsnC family transcriptional regulator
VDKLDRKILDLLQRDASLSVAELAERIGLSKAPCWRRIQRLTDAGLIRRTVALLDARALNVGTTVFVTIKAPNHSAGWYERFAKLVRDMPEVMELHRMSGDVDYLLRVVVPDIEAYGAVYKRLTGALELLDVSASFSLETLKSTTALPLSYATLDR